MVSPKRLKKWRNSFRFWRRVVGRFLKLRVGGDAVEIGFFETDSVLYVEGAVIFPKWEVKNAWLLRMTPGVGNMLPEGRLRITARPGMTQLTLTAYGNGGPVSKTVEFRVLPATLQAVDGRPVASDGPVNPLLGVPGALAPVMQPHRRPFLKKGSLAIRHSSLQLKKNPHPQSLPDHSEIIHDIYQQKPEYQELIRDLGLIASAPGTAEIENLKILLEKEYNEPHHE